MKNAAWIELLLQLLNSSGPVSAAIRQAQAEGRALTREELQAAFDQDDAARDHLVAAIDAASG
jgi:hypothetical protein